MRKWGKKRPQICTLVDEGDQAEDMGSTFYINHSFHCDSEGLVYLIRVKI